ncbi:MAG: hypothetical protein ACQKBU_07520 [Verrucomicrobiales bacterium]
MKIRILSWRTLRPLVVGGFALLFAAGLLVSAEPAAGQKRDPTSGLIIDENWQLVQAMCSSCHSPKLITNYGATRERWASLIDWMQAKQGLWEFPAELEDQILNYLEANYPPREESRRAILDVKLRPPNPYAKDTTRLPTSKLK